LQAAGLKVKLLPTPGSENDRNSLFIASAEPQDFTNLRSPLLFKGKPVAVDSLFLDRNKSDLQNAVVFSDDKTSLDRLNFKAAEIWRKAYNGTITKFFMENGVPLFH
jgi:hypothetical protein